MRPSRLPTQEGARPQDLRLVSLQLLMPEPELTKEEADAIATLAKRGRLLVIVIPKGIPTEKVQALQADVNERLEQLARERGPLT